MQPNNQTSKHSLMWKIHSELRMTVMHALPQQYASHSDIKTIQISLDKNCCSAGFRHERALDLGNAGGNRESPSLTRPPDPCAIPTISIAATPRSVPSESGMYCSGEKLNQPLLFFLERADCASSAPRTFCCLEWSNDIRLQYACANNKLCESSSTSSMSTSSEEDRQSVDPFLWREETAGRASDPREGTLDLMRKEEDRGSPVFIPSSQPPREPTLHASLPIRPCTNCVYPHLFDVVWAGKNTQSVTWSAFALMLCLCLFFLGLDKLELCMLLEL